MSNFKKQDLGYLAAFGAGVLAGGLVGGMVATNSKNSTNENNAVINNDTWVKTNNENQINNNSSSESKIEIIVEPPPQVPLVAVLPFESINDSNQRQFNFLIVNTQANLFNPAQVLKISNSIKSFINEYVFPSWRMTCNISMGVPQTGTSNEVKDPSQQLGSYIPIYLVNEFNTDTTNNFAAALHGCVSTSIMNGPNASVYLPYNFNFTPLPCGTPYIIVPAGSTQTGNGIVGAQESSNIIDFDAQFCMTLCHEIIETLINPTGVRYIAAGDPWGPAQEEFLYLREACDPVSLGIDNSFSYSGSLMPNFVLPAYFMPLSKGPQYDMLNRCSGPFTPFKGTQFYLYQKCESKTNLSQVSEVMIMNKYSSDADPTNLQIISNGSVYDYASWGLQQTNSLPGAKKYAGQGDIKTKFESIYKTLAVEGLTQSLEFEYSYVKKFKGITKVHGLRQQMTNSLTQGMVSGTLVSSSFSPPGAGFTMAPNTPYLFPWQYLDNDGLVTNRMIFINYIPDVIQPTAQDSAHKAMVEFVKNQYGPYLGIKCNIVASYSDPNIPARFDNKAMIAIVARMDQFNYNSIGNAAANSGAYNFNSNSNAVSGGRLSDIMTNPPVVPDGIPCVVSPASNYGISTQITLVTTNMGTGTTSSTGTSTIPTSLNSTFAAGSFAYLASNPTLSVTGQLVLVDPILANQTLVNAAALTGNIAVFHQNAPTKSKLLRVAACNPSAIIVVASGPDPLSVNYSPNFLAACVGSVIGGEIINALQNGFQITATIVPGNDPSIPLSSYTGVFTHEIEEMCGDPAYADYILSGNPPVDLAIVGSQIQYADPVEILSVYSRSSADGKVYTMSDFPLPGYFLANSRMTSFSLSGEGIKPLIPFHRQQVLIMNKGNNMQYTNVINSRMGNTVNSLYVYQGGDDTNIFNPAYLGAGPTVNSASQNFVINTPFASVYQNLFSDQFSA